MSKNKAGGNTTQVINNHFMHHKKKTSPLIQLTICKLALFKHLAETLAEFQVALVLGALNELLQLIRASLLLGGFLLVHGLRLVWLSLVRLGLVRLLKRTKKLWNLGKNDNQHFEFKIV